MGRKFFDNCEEERNTKPIKMSWKDYKEKICTGDICKGREVRVDFNYRTKKATVWLTDTEIKEYEKKKKRTSIRG